MKANYHLIQNRRAELVPTLFGLTLAAALLAQPLLAQAQTAGSESGDAHAAKTIYKTFYLTNLTQTHDANEIQTDLRNMLPNARLFYVPSQNAISLRSTPEDIALAEEILADLDRTKKVYRLTYTLTDLDGGRRIGTQRIALVVASGGSTDIKQGSKVPLVIGMTEPETNAASHSQVQYQDVGLEIEASLEGSPDGVKVRSKIAQSSVADEKSGIGAQDPLFHQTTLDGVSILSPGKPLVLGSLDVPGTTRHQEVEVVSEVIR